MLFRKLFVLASVCASSFASTIGEVQQSTTALVVSVQKVGDAMAALSPTPGVASVSQLKAVKVAGDDLAVSIEKTTQTVLVLSPSPPSDQDGHVIINQFKELEAAVKDALARLTERKASLASLASVPLLGRPSVSYMKSQFLSLLAGVNKLEDAFEAAAPASLAGQGKLLRAQFDSAFQQAIAVIDDALNSA